MPRIRSGELNRRCWLQRNAAEVRDGHGNPEPDWQPTAGPIFCKVEAVGGGKNFSADQVHADATHLITIRWRAGIDPRNHRVLLRNPGETERVLKIELLVNVDEANEVMLLHVAERAGEEAVTV